MMRLLLLLILFPVVLFGQTRKKAIVDSIKAADTDIQTVSEIISNNPGNNVEAINVSDSGAYVTITVRVHVTEAISIRPVAKLPATRMKIKNNIAPFAINVELPPMPRLKLEPDIVVSLAPHALAGFDIKKVAIAKMDEVAMPILPDLKPYIPAVGFHTITPFKIEKIVFSKMETLTMPDLPEVEIKSIDEVLLVEVVPLAIEIAPIDKMDTVVVVVFEEKKMPVEEMHLSDEGYSLLEKLEGFSPELYALGDGGLTIGFGFFVPYSEGNKWEKGVTWDEAERLMRQKVPTYENQVKKYINVPLTQKEFDALTMLAYNLGGFSKATSIVNDINTEADFEQLRKDWMRFVHSKAPGVMKGLINRRKDEMKVRNEANYQPERKIRIYKNR